MQLNVVNLMGLGIFGWVFIYSIVSRICHCIENCAKARLCVSFSNIKSIDSLIKEMSNHQDDGK